MSTYLGNRATDAWNYSSFFVDASTTLASTLLAVVIGAYVLFRGAEYFGLPVWLWLSQAMQIVIDYPLIRSGFQLPSLLAFRLRGRHTVSGDDDKSADIQRSAGNILSSVFGLNTGGLLQKGVRGVTGALSKHYNNVPPGLGNWDNSCYQNSVIQGLASLPSLREYLSKMTTEYRALNSETTNGALFDMITKLNDPENHGQHFWIRGILKSMSTFQQQDAQEYYSKMLDALDKEVQKASNTKRRSAASWLLAAKALKGLPRVAAAELVTKDALGGQSEEETRTNAGGNEMPPEQPQIISNPLDGLQAQRVGCINCGYTEGLSLIPFNCVTVPLGSRWIYDVRECLDEYTSLELIEGVECAKCTLLKRKEDLAKMLGNKKATESLRATVNERLQIVQDALDDEDFEDSTLVKKCSIPKKSWVQSTKSRQAVIARAPKSLVLHVNRSVFDEYTGAQLKNTATVRFPKILDLGFWCLGSQPSQSHLPDDSVEESWPRDPTKSMLRRPVGEEDILRKNSPFQYDLRAVVTHYGRHENGHYICYRRHPFKMAEQVVNHEEEAEEAQNQEASERWWRLSDEDVTAVTEDTVLQQGGVFMLFYERINVQPDTIPSTSDSPVDSHTIAFEDVPLPSVDIASIKPQSFVVSPDALETPLPDDDEDLLPSPPASPVLSENIETPTDSTAHDNPQSSISETIDLSSLPNTDVYPTPPPEPQRLTAPCDTGPSVPQNTAYDSEGSPSTQFASDDDVESQHVEASPPQGVSPSPHLMRAGDTPRRGKGSRTSMPMVTAL
ncbi:cysteine proteinase [Lojkania enalia]|uniref:ubiquitinyl hydrolase 1 n=1 Tax=Lojkania enalia TaxID=147567 RepID=A0A9P4N8H0_9PLEO|nr:cysteine proteinase [Didymosphaeria enalia]